MSVILKVGDHFQRFKNNCTYKNSCSYVKIFKKMKDCKFYSSSLPELNGVTYDSYQARSSLKTKYPFIEYSKASKFSMLFLNSENVVVFHITMNETGIHVFYSIKTKLPIPFLRKTKLDSILPEL